MELVIGHLYPELLNLYGDKGNILTLKKRCEWRGIQSKVVSFTLNDDIDFDSFDIILLGGGSDREQNLVCKELLSKKDSFKKYIEENKVLIAICGGYQLLGHFYMSSEGKIPGLGLIDIYTESGDVRLIGNVAIETEIDGKKLNIVGFENHAGRTYINNNSPLGKVISGFGNNGEDKYEGIRYKNVFGTYLHGPLLPKNPELADYFISLALKNKGETGNLTDLIDSMEQKAHEVMFERIIKNSKKG